MLKLSQGDWAGVSGVDFANGASKIKISVKSSEGALVRITTGSCDGDVCAYIYVPASSELVEVEQEVTGLEGVQDLFFTSAGDITIDSWTFE